MSNEQVKKPKKKKQMLPVVLSAVALVLIASLVIVFIVVNDHSEIYKMVKKAIVNTESQSEVLLRFDTTANVTQGEKVYKTDTGGVVCGFNNMKDVFVSINAVSTTPEDTSSDFNVTASFYSDGEKVYDISSGAEVEADITPQEFDSIISEYELYRYKESYAKEAIFNENQLEEFKGSGEVTVTLTSPGDEVLSVYAQAISEFTGEKVTKDDLKVNAAFVSYVIYDELVSNQSYTFSVEYTPRNGDKVFYTVSSQVSFSDELTEYEEYDYYKSFFIEEE